MPTYDEWQSLRLTVIVSATAVAVSFPAAVAFGWLLAKRQFPGKSILETCLQLPLVLPPVVTGYALLVLFGRQGWLGGWLERHWGWQFVFDWKGAVLAAAVVGFPLFVRPIRQAFTAVDERLTQAARSLGAGPFDAFCTITLPLARPGIFSGALLAFARGMGEFGATLMIAGNIPGYTRTLPLAIYSQLETPDGFQKASRLVVISVVISALALILGEILERRGSCVIGNQESE